MIFGRKPREAVTQDDQVVDDVPADAGASDETDPADEPDSDRTDPGAPFDPRADGPFDHEEVDLEGDETQRLAFGPLIVTPFPGVAIQLHGDPQSGSVFALLASFESSGLELALFAAPRSGGLADELREDIREEAAQAGGNAEEGSGPFGPEVRRVLPMEGPEGEQLFHVSRIWLVEGPRWLLRGTLLGQAAIAEGETGPAAVFAEFFRNVVVRRDDAPRVPGELIHLGLPEKAPRG